MMSVLTVHHSTVYRYGEPVRLGEDRMMFRPRESHDLRLIRSKLAIEPEPTELRRLHILSITPSLLPLLTALRPSLVSTAP